MGGSQPVGTYSVAYPQSAPIPTVNTSGAQPVIDGKGSGVAGWSTIILIIVAIAAGYFFLVKGGKLK